MIIINNIKTPLDTEFSNISDIVENKLKIDKSDIISAKLYKKSVDARDKSNVHFCISVIADIKNEAKILKKNKNCSEFKPKEYVWQKLKSDIQPVIIGFGPAGMFAALTLARAGLKPIVFERGQNVDTRTNDVNTFFDGGKLNPESNVQFGEGGAGTFSDGKLNSGIKDIRCRTVLEVFNQFGASEDILIDAKPHIGTDVLKNIVKNIRNEIISLGGEVNFGSKLDNLFCKEGKLTHISVNGKKMPCEHLCLCIGHSARDTFKMLFDNGLQMTRKPFAMGVRIEHLQNEINKSLYGEYSNHPALKAADYKLAVHLENGRGVYTFCMCPGGEVINASSDDGGIAVNGMSNSRRDGINANSALLVGINPEDLEGNDIFEGCRLQQSIENKAYNIADGAVPITTVDNFVFGNEPKLGQVIPTVKPNYSFADFNNIFPAFITDSLKHGILAMDKKIKGFATPDAVLTAPETRSSSPIRIVRETNGLAIGHSGIYPCGEGAGYAGGIMSAAVDGIKTAENIINAINCK
ncbi:MAG: FAD-binding protein [Clostridia bacterium]|nr:FAD-binding protein [Clostridia bacterium]